MHLYIIKYNLQNINMNIEYITIIPKTKKFGCVGRGDLTFLFKSCEMYESQRRLI